ncbi:MAG: MerR family transcriptional regulator [Spirochaetota bacterium]|nr:MerR family transcriptional regulator [Spirochaetota bacterium]
MKEKNYYTIGEVSQIVDLKEHVLRFWEKEFKELAPQKSIKGRRKYTKRDIQVIERIKSLLHKEGFTIIGARKHLTLEMRNEVTQDTTPSPNSLSYHEREKIVSKLKEIVQLLK